MTGVDINIQSESYELKQSQGVIWSSARSIYVLVIVLLWMLEKFDCREVVLMDENKY